MNSNLEMWLAECETLHGHICPGQVLGVRMALLGCSLIGVTDPQGRDRKKLIVWVEIDRCLADAVGAVTGVRLGRRSLKFLDYGKVAATFLNTESQQGVRMSALESSRKLADEKFPGLESKKERQMRAYRLASDNELFKIEAVRVKYTESDAPGRPKARTLCLECGEGINDGREIMGADGRTLCRPCMAGAYYEVLS